MENDPMTCGCGHDETIHNHQTDACKADDCGCCEFITDIQEWKNAKARWDWENAQDEGYEAEAFHQARLEREDNEPPSGSTDLGNLGGTTFCY